MRWFEVVEIIIRLQACIKFLTVFIYVQVNALLSILLIDRDIFYSTLSATMYVAWGKSPQYPLTSLSELSVSCQRYIRNYAILSVSGESPKKDN